ncbi:MAG: hypothetical protein IIZ39_15050 [Blautia sp.]|nr:hypothetical protein [Blautia sp.]
MTQILRPTATLKAEKPFILQKSLVKNIAQLGPIANHYAFLLCQDTLAGGVGS